MHTYMSQLDNNHSYFGHEISMNNSKGMSLGTPGDHPSATSMFYIYLAYQ